MDNTHTKAPEVATVCITKCQLFIKVHWHKFLTNYFENLIANKRHTINVCQKHDDFTEQGCNTPETKVFFFIYILTSTKVPLKTTGLEQACTQCIARCSTSWLHYATRCNTQSSVPEDGQNNCPKHVELNGITNKPLLLHLVGCLYYQ